MIFVSVQDIKQCWNVFGMNFFHPSCPLRTETHQNDCTSHQGSSFVGFQRIGNNERRLRNLAYTVLVYQAFS